MARLYLIRHGEPAATWGESPDPGLSDKGHAQARAAAARLDALGVRYSLSSPLMRCRQTAAAFAAGPRPPARLTPEVGEIPSPADHPNREEWLRQAFSGGWGDLPELGGWREALLATLQAQTQDSAVFTHFVAINAAVGAATGSDRVLLFRPAHASITILEAGREGLALVERGEEASGAVL